MKTLSLALRNLLRNRRRTVATLAAIAIGATSVLLFGGYSADIKYSLQTGYVRNGGHLQIQHRDYYLFGSGDPSAYGIARYADIIDSIKSDPVLRDMVVVVTPKLQFGGVAGNYAAGVSRTILGSGLVATDHVRMREWNSYALDLVDLPMRLADSPPNAAVVGVGLARVLLMCEALGIVDCPTPERTKAAGSEAIPNDIAQLALGEQPSAGTRAAAAPGRRAKTIDLLVSSARGTPNVASFDVTHAENQGFKELDEVSIFIHLAQAQRLVYGSASPKVTSIILQLRDTAQIDAATPRLQALLPVWASGQPLVVRDFASLNPFYVESMQLFDTIFGFMFILIGGIVMFTVTNTMNTAVVERTVEIGTLRAIGLRQSGIRWIFVTEGVLLGISGALLGIVVSLVTAYIVNHMGLQWRPPGSAESVPLHLKVWGEIGMNAGTATGLIVLTTFSAWWPAYRGAGMKIVDALRHV